MKNNLLFVLAISLLAMFSCKNTPAADTPATPAADDVRLDFTIVPGERVGLITADKCTREAVLAAYGDSARVDSIYLGEGMVVEGVVIFPNSPRRSLNIFWDKDMDPARPAFIRILGDSTGATDWKATNGITIGTSIGEIETLNGKPFDLFGFGWDYGGRVTDWKDGQLEGKGIQLDFETSSENTSEKVLGEGVLSSADSLVRQAAPRVTSMEFRFLAKGQLPTCLMDMAKKPRENGGFLVIRKTQHNGQDHWWFSDGAAAYDGIEKVYDSSCKEVCALGGNRLDSKCRDQYANSKWEVIWEEE